jgi:hypothetical protein
MEEPIMAHSPNDPYRSPDDPYLFSSADDDLRRANRLERESQIDPDLAEGPPSAGKVAAFAIAIAVVLGAVFYGLNNTSVNHAGTSSTAQNTQSSPPAAPPATPRANTDKGVTTGAAPAQPQTAPSPAPNPATPPSK